MKRTQRSENRMSWLVWSEIALVLAIAAMALMYIHGSQELQHHQRILATQQQAGRLLNQLIAESAQHRDSFPEIDPLLKALGVRFQTLRDIQEGIPHGN